MENVQKILQSDDPLEIRNLFVFEDEDEEIIIEKFQLWARWFFPKYFTSEDAKFHNEIDLYNLRIYLGSLTSFVNVAFRGAAKTARTKLFIAFCIANDMLHWRKYIKVLSEDGTNSKQIVTDIYNMLINPDVQLVYPEIFQKSHAKREETMSSFTTTTGVKITSDTVGTDQRGAIQEEARPDLIWFEDFENRVTLRSAVKTKSIWDNMEEARTGLAKRGSCIYTCNYISERGNVHTLITKKSSNKFVLIVPIMRDGATTWDRYSMAEIEQMKIDDDDFEGERMCEPSASKDIIFDREKIDRMDKRIVLQEIGGLRIYRGFNPAHRYAAASDVAGGVGLDSSTTVIMDFSTIPMQVVATYENNEIKPDIFGDEIARQAQKFGECLVGPEKNNHGAATIGRLKQIYPLDKIFKTPSKDTKVDKPKTGKNPQLPTEYGWHTNAATKPKMIFDFVKAVDDGLLVLNCPYLIAEARSYTRNDLMDAEIDPRLTTRHFDLLIAAAICWQLRFFADFSSIEKLKAAAVQDEVNNADFDPLAVI